MLTASVSATPFATFDNVTAAPVPPNVTVLCAVVSYLTASTDPVSAAAPAAVTAAATSVYVTPPTVMVGLLILPVAGSSVEPPPIAAAALDAVLNSCEPLTASELVALSVPAVSFVIFVEPAVPFSVIVSIDVLLS